MIIKNYVMRNGENFRVLDGSKNIAQALADAKTTYDDDLIKEQPVLIELLGETLLLSERYILREVLRHNLFREVRVNQILINRDVIILILNNKDYEEKIINQDSAFDYKDAKGDKEND